MEADVEEPHVKRPASEEQSINHPGWLQLFAFTSRAHLFPLTLALILSVASGVAVPIVAVLLGKLFDCFTEFGAGNFSGPELVAKVSHWAIALTALGCASGVLNAGYFMLWLSFGELQAKNARDSLFQGMLEKDMEWYDMRKDGVAALIQRLQTYVSGHLSLYPH